MYNEYADPMWQYGTETMETGEGIVAFLAGFYMVLLIFGIIVLVLELVANWKLFKKAGESGWKCLIPFYSFWVRIRIALGRNSIGWFILYLIPLVNIIPSYYINFYFAKRFSGKDSIGLLYLFLATPVGILMAFSDRYQYIQNRSPEDSGRGGIDGDFPLWAMEDGVSPSHETPGSRYDSRMNYPGSERNSNDTF